MISDHSLERHLRGAESFINSALRPGTRANHASILRTYIDFTCAHGLAYARPTVSSICAFIHYLTIKYDKSSTILNSISSLSSVLRRMGVDVTPFSSINVQDFVVSIKTNIRHVPFKRPPVLFTMLPSILAAARAQNNGLPVAFAILIMYYTFFRQSNLCPRNKSGFDPSRHLVRADVLWRPEGLVLAVKWAKTRQTFTASSVGAPAMPRREMCPLVAYRDMIAYSPTIHQNQPLIAFCNGSPMPLTYLRKAWAHALATIGADSHLYTLHSLRRGGATDVHSTGTASLQEIKDHGDWRSDAVHHYLPNDPMHSSVMTAFRDLKS